MDVSLAEVADKTVDHIANGVQQIAATVEKLAPGAWDIAVRQARISGYLDVAVGLIVLVATVLGTRFLWPRAGKCDEIDRGMFRGFIGFFVFVGLGLAMVLMRNGVLVSLNAEYYAAQNIAHMLHH